MARASHDYYDHPVFNPLKLHLATPAIRQLNRDIHQWLWTGTTGGLITGTARVGKTTALQSLASQLFMRGRTQIPVYQVSIPKRDKHTVLTVFRQLCFSANLRVSPRDIADHLSDRYIQFIADAAVEAKCNRAVLMVDEMQRLKAPQFDAFAELYDKLLLLNIALTVLFIGNDPECWPLVEEVENDRYAHIHGRFFTQGVEFLGLSSMRQVNDCLKQYDELRYPTQKDPTYTAFFLPEEFKKGWRLASLSSDLWHVFHCYQLQYHLKSWGMQYFTATINTLLSDFLPRYGVDRFDEDMVHECIRLSGLVPSLVRPTG
jgi:hypothetical protein